MGGVNLEDDEILGVEVYVDDVVSSKIQIQVMGEIGPPQHFADAVYYLENASEDDEIEILINSDGGQVQGALHLVSAMRRCKAHIKAVITGECCSAATYIFFSADAWEVPDFATLMIHSTQHGMYGTPAEVKHFNNHEIKHLEHTSKLFYKDFLSPKEIKEMVEGQRTFWFMGEEVVKRLENKVKKQEEELESETTDTEDQ